MCTQEIKSERQLKIQTVFKATNPLLIAAQERPAMPILTPAEAWILIILK